MAIMTYEDFKCEVIDNIMDYLDEEYQDMSMRTQMIQKSGYEYEGLIIAKKERETVTPTLNLTEAYKEYSSGKPFVDVLRKLARTRMKAVIPGMDTTMITSYGRASCNLYPRLVNKETNKDYLADKVYTTMEDLAIVYMVIVNEDDKGIAAVAVTQDLLKMWSVTLGEVHNKAIENLSESEYTFVNLAEALFSKKTNTPIEDIDFDDYLVPFFILSNKRLTKGAAMAINPKVMDRIVEKFGEVYVVPSSTEEVLIAPQSMSPSAGELAEMVRSINASEVEPEDRLSDNVYEYDRETKMLRRVVE